VRTSFAVLGLGRFGESLARTLVQLGHEVIAIDSDQERINGLASFVTRAFCTDITDEQSLMQTGVQNVDVAVVATSTDIHTSIIATMLLKEIGVKHVIAKASTDMHGRVLSRVGADRVVYPERDMGTRVAHGLVSSYILDFIELDPSVGVAELPAPEKLVGKSIRSLDLRNRFGVNIIAIKRSEGFNILVKADDVLQAGDVIVVIGNMEDLRRMEKL
jgi:trk system potassium uptake protein TrkA